MRAAEVFFASCLVVIAGCGSGGGSGANSTSGVGSDGGGSATPTTTLVSSVSSLALVVQDTARSRFLSGTPRTVTVTNGGGNAAFGVGYTVSSPPPSGTTIVPASCGDLAPNASCVLTVTPGNRPAPQAR